MGDKLGQGFSRECGIEGQNLHWPVKRDAPIFAKPMLLLQSGLTCDA